MSKDKKKKLQGIVFRGFLRTVETIKTSPGAGQSNN